MERDGEGGVNFYKSTKPLKAGDVVYASDIKPLSVEDKEEYNQLVERQIKHLSTWKWKLFSQYPICFWQIDNGATIKYPWFRTIRTRMAEGTIIPKRFGLAYRSFDTDTMHYVIYPFNFIVALGRRLYFATRFEIPYAFINYERDWRKRYGKSN